MKQAPGISSKSKKRAQSRNSRLSGEVTQERAAEQTFSLRTISTLDRGQYYVQIAALPVELLENTIRQFDPQFLSFNPVIFRDRDNLYRILIGPLNQGESAAVLARFRSIGYNDAFVRRGG